MLPGEPIRVVIIEDDPLTRDGLRMLIGGSPGFFCATGSASVEDALLLPADLDPDVILLDIHLPGILGSQGIPLLRARFRRAQVIMLTVFAEDSKVF